MSILQNGDTVRETYEVERLLGQGAFAEVYRVKHRFMGRQAMKVFKAVNATQAEIEKSIAEAVLLSRMKHPNIVEVYDANVLSGRSGTYGYFTMTYVPGGTLERYWRSFGANFVPADQVVEVARQICRGLAVAHSSSPPIIHRDIKPQNVLVGYGAEGLQVRLSDFGLAKSVNPLTLLASSKGTLGFKPPESLDNIDSPAADIWAVGTTMYLMLTDQMPFPLLGERDVGDANRFMRPMRPASIYNIAVDAGLEAVLARCLATKPADRYPDARALLEDLERWGAPAAHDVPGGQSTFSAKSDAITPPGRETQVDVRALVSEAIKAATDPTQLAHAADMMEEAMGRDATIRDQYESHVRLWRKGIMHVSTASFGQRNKGPGARE